MKKNLLSLLFIGLTLVIILVLAFSNSELTNAWEVLFTLDLKWVFCALLGWGAYMFFDMTSLYYFLRKEKQNITLGYALILLLLGCVREWLALGSVFGIPLSRSVLPMAGMPAGGFIVLGVVCAIWRALARKRQKYLKNEARGYLAVHPQSQESGKEEKE